MLVSCVLRSDLNAEEAIASFIKGYDGIKSLKKPLEKIMSSENHKSSNIFRKYAFDNTVFGMPLKQKVAIGNELYKQIK